MGKESADWLKIKKAYVRGGKSYAELSQKYGVSVSTLSKVASKEHWAEARKECRQKADAKIANAQASRIADRAMRISEAADRVLGKLLEAIDALTAENILEDGRLIKSITGAIKDIKDIQDIKSAQDIKEQEARIAMLQKQIDEDKRDEDKEIVVTFAGSDAAEAEEFAK